MAITLIVDVIVEAARIPDARLVDTKLTFGDRVGVDAGVTTCYFGAKLPADAGLVHPRVSATVSTNKGVNICCLDAAMNTDAALVINFGAKVVADAAVSWNQRRVDAALGWS